MTCTESSVSISSAKGYRTARSVLTVNEGAWYFEVVVVHLGESGHVRVGWSNDKVELNAPVGFDEHGYGYCDVAGEKIHHRNRQLYGEAYAAGDVVGCYIYLKPMVTQQSSGTALEAAGQGHSLKGEDGESPRADEIENCSEVDDSNVHREAMSTAEGHGAASALSSDTDNSGGRVAFAKNGVSQGIAYHLTKPSAFSPTASLFTLGKTEPLAKVSFNFGPHFVHPPPAFEDLPAPKPISECASSAAVSNKSAENFKSAEEFCSVEENVNRT